MREHYIDNKVVLLSKRNKPKNAIIDKMNKARRLHYLCNRIQQEIARHYGEAEHKALNSIFKILRDEIH